MTATTARLMGLLALCAAASGCATMSNPGRLHSVNANGEPMRPGDQGGVRAGLMPLHHWSSDIRIYEGERQLRVLDRDSAKAAFVLADLASTCRETEAVMRGNPQDLANFRRDHPEGCDIHGFFEPVVRLEMDRSHTLRIVRGGREATITVAPSFHPKWIYWNFWLMVAYPAGLLVDGLHHSWTYFSGIDVVQALGSTANAAGH